MASYILTMFSYLISLGIMFIYAIYQVTVWWLLHTSAVFWKIQFPIHALKMSHRIKYIHLSCVIVGLLFPLASIITTMADFAIELKTNVALQERNITFLSGGLGYRQDRFPGLLCSGRNTRALYYSTILPINIMVLIGMTELILLFWTIHRVRI